MLVDELRNFKNPTPQEKAIIDYVLAHPDFVRTCSAHSLADATLTSPPTVTRLCKRLGLRGFDEFRLSFVMERCTSAEGVIAGLTKPIVCRSSSLSDIGDVLPRFYSRIVYETNARISGKRLDEVLDLLRNASFVDLYAMGINYFVSSKFVFDLQTLGVAASIYDTPNIHMVEHLRPSDGHLSILVSHTGENRGMTDTAKILRRRGLRTVGISSSPDSSLARVTDMSLELFTTPTVNKLSTVAYPLSLSYLFDLLYVALLPTNLTSIFDKEPNVFYAEEEMPD